MFKPKIVDGQDFTNCSICETVRQLCVAMDLLNGLKITRAKYYPRPAKMPFYVQPLMSTGNSGFTFTLLTDDWQQRFYFKIAISSQLVIAISTSICYCQLTVSSQKNIKKAIASWFKFWSIKGKFCLSASIADVYSRFLNLFCCCTLIYAAACM